MALQQQAQQAAHCFAQAVWHLQQAAAGNAPHAAAAHAASAAWEAMAAVDGAAMPALADWLGSG